MYHCTNTFPSYTFDNLPIQELPTASFTFVLIYTGNTKNLITFMLSEGNTSQHRTTQALAICQPVTCYKKAIKPRK